MNTAVTVHSAAGLQTRSKFETPCDTKRTTIMQKTLLLLTALAITLAAITAANAKITVIKVKQSGRGSAVMLNPQPLPPKEKLALNPQPLPPRR
jgi:hypothetical protein